MKQRTPHLQDKALFFGMISLYESVTHVVAWPT